MADFRNLAPFPKLPQLRLGSKGITFIIGAIIIILIILDGLVSVPPGHVGIIYDRGRGVLANELPEGLHLKIPLKSRIYHDERKLRLLTWHRHFLQL